MTEKELTVGFKRDEDTNKLRVSITDGDIEWAVLLNYENAMNLTYNILPHLMKSIERHYEQMKKDYL